MKIDPIALHRRSPAGLAAALALAWLVAAPVRAVEAPGAGAPARVPTAGWQRPSKADLKHELTPEQYRVTQEDGTEPPFRNAYWNNHKAGIYVDLVSGEPLFASLQKFESGTGWPSFYAPLEPGNIVQRTDRTLGMERTEVRSKLGDSHLGHVFDDGPRPTGLRYCINSASLRFVPVADLEREGYSKYLPLFNGDKAETSPVGR